MGHTSEFAAGSWIVRQAPSCEEISNNKLSGYNTMAGVGKDLEKAGEAIQDSSN